VVIKLSTVMITDDEARIMGWVLALILNDPDWQEVASATDAEWNALRSAYAKITASQLEGD
jgi:hypothetical protein